MLARAMAQISVKNLEELSRVKPMGLNLYRVKETGDLVFYDPCQGWVSVVTEKVVLAEFQVVTDPDELGDEVEDKS